MSPSKTIVVGIDGSEPSRHALRWALDEARLRGADLRVVYAWPAPFNIAGPYEQMGPQYDESAKPADQMVAEELVEHELEAEDVTGIRTEKRIAQGSPVQALLDAASDADLLVVGTRGRGGFKGLLLGSVSQQCVAHATCPVVVTHGASES